MALLNSPSHSAKVAIHFQTIASSLHSRSSLKQAKLFHTCILRNNLPQHLYAKLLLFCTSPTVSTDALDYATLVFQQLQQDPTIVMWNTMIRCYASSNTPSQAISFYGSMRDRCMKPNNYMFTFIIKACAANSCLFDLHVNMYASAAGGNVEAARSLFDRIRYRTAATWNAMLAGYARKGNIEAARDLFDQMPNKDGQSWHEMVCGYMKIGKFDEAGRLFKGMPVRTLPSWNAMISAYVRASRPVEAFALFRKMQIVGMSPDEITVVSVLPACAQLGALVSGEWIHLYVERNRLDCKISVCNAIIDMYSKSGCINKATAVFKGMRKRSLVSWNTMISGLAIHG
ncbi:hypothetical protein HHK36_016514 [Tetracentron sinense]|uniref:Pentatricopeptide repeat-containing protein n=1 Tax=Tetracentron sinense TaxID=13715 RepID=A0A835DER8_TETSI|nr:hypothetical protein HHK36_016514 [Tetracentron sinense]